MALDLNFDGLMIETHIDPDNAWSDAAQQITPNRLIQIMKDLKMRKTTIDKKDYVNELENLRTQIDIADQSLLQILGERMNISDSIGKLKRKIMLLFFRTKGGMKYSVKWYLTGKPWII